MKQQFDNVLKYIKEDLDVDGCITGSIMLGYMPDQNQDIDLFVYSETAFTKAIYALYYNPMFLILEPMEKWKFDDWTNNPYRGSLKKLGLVSIKFKYNMCIDVNIIFKEKNHSIFDVLSSFDMDIISSGYEISTKQTLDLSNGSQQSKIASWNKWNKTFYTPNIWTVSRILRQFLRIQKYTDRGYDCTPMAYKYIEILKDAINYESIFNSDKVSEKIDSIKLNGTILIQIIEKWLKVKTLTKEEIVLIDELIKKL